MFVATSAECLYECNVKSTTLVQTDKSQQLLELLILFTYPLFDQEGPVENISSARDSWSKNK